MKWSGLSGKDVLFAAIAMALMSVPKVQRRGLPLSKKYTPLITRYMPHQGERECARRVRQMAKVLA